MKFVLKPSLEHVTLVQIVISFWNQNDVRALISKLGPGGLYINQWKTIEERVREKVTRLSLPELLKAKVFGIIKPIGLEILEWMKYHYRYNAWYDIHSLDLDLLAHVPADLCWTQQGTVDRKKTAEVLVRDENLDIFTRYILACDYCLEDDIVRFWNKLPEDLKDYDWDCYPVISFWSDNMKRGGAGHISYKDVFYRSTVGDNKVASLYFLQKLTPQEREESFEKLAKDIRDVDDADVLCFLLAKMEDKQQMLVFKSDPCRVLWCFLQWPFQGFFIGIANCMWDFLSRHNYDEILGDIIGKVREGYKDYNYQKLFGDFWQKSPSALKDSFIDLSFIFVLIRLYYLSRHNYDEILGDIIGKVREGYKDYNYQKLFGDFWQKSPSALKDSFIDEIDNSWLLQCLFDIKDKENIRLILKDAPLTVKEKLIYSEEIKNFCKRFIRNNEWDFLQFFIRECFSSKKEMLKFKVEFEKSVMHSYFNEHFATKKQEWDQLFHFLDDSSVEEGESHSSERFQSLW